MKRILTIVVAIPLLVFSKPCHAQSVTANAGFALFTAKSFQTSIGANVGVGYGSEKFDAGLNFNIFEFDSKKRKYVVIAGDAKIYVHPLTETITPFVEFQPGFVVNSPTVYAGPEKGNFAFSVLGGLKLKQEDNLIGGTISLGYSNISFKADATGTRHYGGLIVVLAIVI